MLYGSVVAGIFFLVLTRVANRPFAACPDRANPDGGMTAIAILAHGEKLLIARVHVFGATASHFGGSFRIVGATRRQQKNQGSASREIMGHAGNMGLCKAPSSGLTRAFWSR